jgi:hypothetical protein
LISSRIRRSICQLILGDARLAVELEGTVERGAQRVFGRKRRLWDEFLDDLGQQERTERR